MRILEKVGSIFESVLPRRKRSCREIVAAWISEKSAEVNPKKIIEYKLYLDQFFDHCCKYDASIALITKDDIIKFRNDQKNKFRNSTVNLKISVVKHFFKTQVINGIINTNPSEYVQKLKVARSVRNPFSVDELKKIINASGQEWRSMVMIGLYTGQRMGDVANLRRENVDFKKCVITLKTSKTGREMNIPIAPPLERFLILKFNQKNKGFDFPLHPTLMGKYNRKNGSAIVSAEFGRILSKCGLRQKPVNRPELHSEARIEYPLSYHCLRHTAVSMLADAGTPLAIIMEIIGHSTVAMSLHYTHPGQAALRRAVETLPDFAA